MPFIISQAEPTFFGNPGYAVPMPMITTAQAVRGHLTRSRQQYDPTINYADYSYGYAKSMPDMDMYSGLSGLGYVRRGSKPLPTIPDTYPATVEPYVSFLNMDVGVDPGIYDDAPYGLGAAPKPLTMPVKPDEETLPLPPPILPSTKTLVIGGTALFVGISIATYIFLKSRKGGKK